MAQSSVPTPQAYRLSSVKASTPSPAYTVAAGVNQTAAIWGTPVAGRRGRQRQSRRQYWRRLLRATQDGTPITAVVLLNTRRRSEAKVTCEGQPQGDRNVQDVQVNHTRKFSATKEAAVRRDCVKRYDLCTSSTSQQTQ